MPRGGYRRWRKSIGDVNPCATCAALAQGLVRLRAQVAKGLSGAKKLKKFEKAFRMWGCAGAKG